MPDGMPYYVEKGPYFSLLDSLSEHGATVLLDIRTELLAGTKIAAIAAGLTSPADPPADPFNGAGFAKHLGEDWFGDADPANKLTTGWWRGYDANRYVEAVMRETLVRAIEVSLGLQHGATVTGYETPRHWPIQFFWICGSRWFEGWVNWNSWGANVSDAAAGPQIKSAAESGVVTVMFVTPGMAGKTIYRKPQRKNRVGTADYRDDPKISTDPNGLWVISAEEHKSKIIGQGQGWRRIEQDMFAIPAWFEEAIFIDEPKPDAGKEPVPVVVAPAEIDGGVRSVGRKW